MLQRQSGSERYRVAPPVGAFQGQVLPSRGLSRCAGASLRNFGALTKEKRPPRVTRGADEPHRSCIPLKSGANPGKIWALASADPCASRVLCWYLSNPTANENRRQIKGKPCLAPRISRTPRGSVLQRKIAGKAVVGVRLACGCNIESFERASAGRGLRLEPWR